MKHSVAKKYTAAKNESDRPREPPLPPTPLQFPLYPPNGALGQTQYTSQEICRLFTTIHKTGPKIDHLRALSIGASEVSLEQLVPKGYLPEVSWNQDPATAEGPTVLPASAPSSTTLSNGAPTPGREAWYKSAKELLYDNEDVFRVLQGKPPLPGRPKLRVAMFRKFWDFLQQMGMYWDESHDKYENVPDDTAVEVMDIDKIYKENQASEEAEEKKATQTYTGWRIGTGREMPARFREDTVFAFVETIAMAFRCKADRPRMEPKVKLQNILIPLPQAGTVYRCPQDRNQAKRGILEGPLMAIQCTNQTVFRRPGEVDGEGQGEVTSLLREVGLMLSIAQKRARDGQKEPDPSEGEWWATKPRWGGGLGADKIQSNEGNNEDDPQGSSKGNKRPKRSNAMESWKNLEPGPSQWEKGISYLQIGKDKDSVYDDVRFFFSFFFYSPPPPPLPEFSILISKSYQTQTNNSIYLPRTPSSHQNHCRSTSSPHSTTTSQSFTSASIPNTSTI